MRLVERKIKTIIIGGFVKQSTDASVGAVALEQIRQLNFDKAFLGMNGIDKTILQRQILKKRPSNALS